MTVIASLNIDCTTTVVKDNNSCYQPDIITLTSTTIKNNIERFDIDILCLQSITTHDTIISIVNELNNDMTTTHRTKWEFVTCKFNSVSGQQYLATIWDSDKFRIVGNNVQYQNVGFGTKTEFYHAMMCSNFEQLSCNAGRHMGPSVLNFCSPTASDDKYYYSLKVKESQEGKYPCGEEGYSKSERLTYWQEMDDLLTTGVIAFGCLERPTEEDEQYERYKWVFDEDRPDLLSLLSNVKDSLQQKYQHNAAVFTECKQITISIVPVSILCTTKTEITSTTDDVVDVPIVKLYEQLIIVSY
jgi:hypothetical protein